MTERRVFMVRAVNVGSTGQLPMAEWRALAEELGANEVSTYIRSGNLVCAPPAPGTRQFERALERGVEERFGFFREVVSRSPAELADALSEYPFGGHDPKRAYVIFLVAEPTADAVASARDIDTGDDDWALNGRELFVRYAAGAGNSNPGMTKVTKLLGVAGTARNLVTVQKLIDLAD